MSRHGSGQSLVEFALIAPVLLVLLLITLDVGRAFSDWIAVSNAAREGAYVASFSYSGDTPDQAVRDAVVGENPSVGIKASEVTVSYSPAGDIVEVSVAHRFDPIAPFIRSLLGSAPPINSRADFPVRLRHYAGVDSATQYSHAYIAADG